MFMYKETDESHVTFIYYWVELLNLYRNVNQLLCLIPENQGSAVSWYCALASISGID